MRSQDPTSLPRRRYSAALLAATVVPHAARAAGATDIPSKPITLIVGFAPGGAMDTIARIVAKKVSEKIGQSVVVQNRAGAGGNIAQEQLYRAEPDGTTLLLANIGSLAINPRLMKMPYSPTELSPVTMAAAFPNVLVVRSDLGVRTLKQFIDLAKKDPEKITVASAGPGTSSHLTAEMFNGRTGLNLTHVPYQGGAPAMMAVLGNQVSAYYATPSSADPYIQNKQVVPIATTGLERAKELPDVPTIAESGYPGFNATNWYAFMLPPKCTPALIKRWNTELVAAMSQPSVVAAFAQHNLVPKPSTPEELAAFIESETASWGKVITERNISVK
ncbi:tripartite tricarboxylate transporter substrate binding protein [soil metagenome]